MRGGRTRDDRRPDDREHGERGDREHGDEHPIHGEQKDD